MYQTFWDWIKLLRKLFLVKINKEGSINFNDRNNQAKLCRLGQLAQISIDWGPKVIPQIKQVSAQGWQLVTSARIPDEPLKVFSKQSTTNLTGDVPQLQPDFQLVIEVDQLEAEVDAEGGAILAPVAEEVVHVATDKRRLAAVHLAHHNHLQQFRRDQ